MKYLLPVFESIWRRAFGDDGFGILVLKERGVLHAINMAVLYSFMNISRGFDTWVSLYITAVIEGLFYSRTFFAGFDMGHSYPPSQAEVDAYGIIGKILNRFFRVNRYMFWYDFLFMTIRYTYPLALVCFWFNPLLLIGGVIVATGYALGWKYRPFGLVTELGEFIMGFVLGALLIIC